MLHHCLLRIQFIIDLQWESQQNCPLIQKVLHQRKFNGCTNACSQKMAPSLSIDQDVLNIESYTSNIAGIKDYIVQQQKTKWPGLYYPSVARETLLAICRISIQKNLTTKARFIRFFRLVDFLQVSKQKNTTKLIFCDVSHLNKSLIHIKSLTYFPLCLLRMLPKCKRWPEEYCMAALWRLSGL